MEAENQKKYSTADWKSPPPSGVGFACSFSGGKDSFLALYQSVLAGGKPECLLTMMDETGVRSRSHGLEKEILLAQAESLDIPLSVRSATWSQYEAQFVDALKAIRRQGIEHCVFGDIDILSHLEWEKKVCLAAELKPHLPLWGRRRKDLLDEFFLAGFQATIVVVKEDVLGREFLGKSLSPSLTSHFEKIGIDPSGENGEYHTVVVDGPLLSKPVQLETAGAPVVDSGYLSLPCRLRR